jgi:hypothetical protein
MKSWIPIAVVLAVAVACSAERYAYAPVRTTSAELAGELAAIYALPPEAPRGEARVATFGITTLSPMGIEDSSLRAVHLAIAVSNRSDDTWKIEPAEARLLIGDRSEAEALYSTTERIVRPQRVDVPAHSSRWIDLFFPLALEARQASELPSYEMLWAIDVGTRKVTLRTTFARFLVERPPSPKGDDLSNPSALPGAEPPNRWPPPHVPE